MFIRSFQVEVGYGEEGLKAALKELDHKTQTGDLFDVISCQDSYVNHQDPPSCARAGTSNLYIVRTLVVREK